MTGVFTELELEALQRDHAASFSGRRVIVTGAGGFIGSHLCDALVALDAQVVAFVRATSSSTAGNIDHLRGRLQIVHGDLADRTSVDELVRRHVDDGAYVFHLAAQAHVGESWQRPYETVTANVVGTLNLLQALTDHGAQIAKLDVAGTSEEYGNVRADVAHHHDFDQRGVVLHERSPLNPTSVYATAKVAADFLTLNYHSAYGLPAVVTRMFNNYGPRQNPRYLTGVVISQALERDRVELGTIDTLRDFCFATDGVRGHLAVAAHGRPGEHYCYGQGENIEIASWAEMILDVGVRLGAWKRVQLVQSSARMRPGSSDVQALRVGYEKLHELTGWKPMVEWGSGIARTIRWYQENRGRWIGQVDWT